MPGATRGRVAGPTIEIDAEDLPLLERALHSDELFTCQHEFLP
jgi:hypothetical protein